jgi:hypothetical protein
VLIFFALIAEGLMGALNYFVKMQYASTIASSQLEDNAAAYQMIHARGTVDNILLLANIIVICLFIFLIVRVWIKKKDELAGNWGKN